MATNTGQLWDVWLAQRDESIFEKLVRPELPATYHLAQRMGLDRADAEDVVQDVLLQLAQVKDRRPGEVGVGAWLMRAVRMKALTSRRTARRRKRHEARRARRKGPAGRDRSAFDVEEEVERALRLLAEDDRQVLVFRFLYDLSYCEIAYVLGASENACRIRVHRASERLRARVGRKSTALLALIPLPAFPTAAKAIAVATQSAAPTAVGAGVLGGVIVSSGMKMAASAAVAAALTAGAFMTFREEPAPLPADPAPVESAQRPADGETSDGAPRSTSPLTAPALKGVSYAGEGVIRGRVATKEGQGVGGVTIVATPGPRPGGGSPHDPPPELDLDTEVNAAVADARRRVGGTRRATTSADGTYSLGGLPDDVFIVRAYAPGYTLRAARGSNTWNVKPGGTVDFVGSASVGVRIEVEGIDEGMAANGNNVLILRAGDEGSLSRAGGSWWTTERPVLRMPPGTWFIQAVQGKERDLASPPEQVTLEAGQHEAAVTLRLAGRPGLRGKLVFLDGLAAQTVRLYALKFEGTEPPSIEGMRRDRAALRGRYDRRDQSYTFREITAGRYVVGVTLGSERVVASAVVDIGDRMVERDIEVGASGLERFVIVRVTGPDGKPLGAERVRITSSFKGPSISIGGGGESIAREDGSWIVTPNAMAPKEGGVHSLRITHPEYGSQELDYDPAARATLDVQLHEPSSLVITTTGLEAAGLKGRAGLYLKRKLEADGMSLSSRKAVASGDVHTFSKVQAGDWHLVMVVFERPEDLRAPPLFVLIDRMPVTIRPGANRITWRLPELHTVRLEPANKEAPLRFQLKRTDGNTMWTHQYGRSDAGGDVVFHFVPAGRYELKGRYGDAERTITIDVPRQTVVRLD